MGCSEVRIPGKHGTGVTPVYVNVMKLLELALHDGYNPNTGKCLRPSSRPFVECRNLKEVIALWEEQLDFYLPFIPADRTGHRGELLYADPDAIPLRRGGLPH